MASSGKKKKKKQISRQSAIDIEAIGLVILALGIFLFGLLVPAVPTGQMGQNFRDNVGGAIGWATILLPWPLIITGVLFITRNNPAFLARALIGYSLFSLGVWLFSSLAAPEVTGKWGLNFQQGVFGAVGWFSYLLAMFIISLGIDLFLNWHPTHAARTTLKLFASYSQQLFQKFRNFRERAKKQANFHADVVLVQNDLKGLEKDLLALNIIHSSPEESNRLAQWRETIEKVRKDLNQPNEELLQETYHVLIGWCESIQKMSDETAEILIEAVQNEQINDFNSLVPEMQQWLAKPLKGITLTTNALNSLRQKLAQQLEQLESQYKALLTAKDNAKTFLDNSLTTKEKINSTLRSLSNQSLKETNIVWSEAGVSTKILTKSFESHQARINKLTTLAKSLEEVRQNSRNLLPWHKFCHQLESFSQEIIPENSSDASFQESFAEFDINLRNDLRDEGESVLVPERLTHWQERLAELQITFQETNAYLKKATEEKEVEEELEQEDKQDNSQGNAQGNFQANNNKNLDLYHTPQQVEFKDLDPEAPLEEVPKTLLEATLKPHLKTPPHTVSEVKTLETPQTTEATEFTFELPQLDFLKRIEKFESMPSSLNLRSQIIDSTIENFKLKGKVQLETSKRGPTVTRFEIKPGEGEKISRYANLSDNIALAMGVASVRIEAPIQGKKDIIGLEVPNEKRDVVHFREAVEAKEFQNTKNQIGMLPVVLGKTIEGEFLVANLTKMPHLLIAGSTGSGKSVAVNVLINSLLYCFLSTELRFLMIDPKMVELTPYDGIPHLLRPVVTNPNDAAGVLLGAVAHMERRYKMMSKIGAKSLEQYNHKAQELDMPQMPFIVIIIDELADLMITSPKEVESAIMRLAQMARATGMHLILATQRPSVDILTSLIKVNVPARMAFAVSSNHDSRTILDTAGAERLTGMGDMLFYQPGLVKPIRLQGPLLNESEIIAVSDFLRKQNPFFNDEFVEAYGSDFDSVSEEESTASGLIDWKDDKLREAAELVIVEGQASVSRLQRRLQVGHARAGKLMDSLEALAIVGPHQGSKPREVLISLEELPNVFGS